MKSIKSSVPAKVFLAGEHAAVYGVPAIVAAVDIRCQIWLREIEGKKDQVEVIDKKLNLKENLSFKEAVLFAKRAKKEWEEYKKTGEISKLTKLMKERLALVKIAVGESLMVMADQPRQRLKLEIDSKIPTGSGLGSSAALSTAIVMALLKDQAKKKIKEVVLAVETRQHGIPSGADQATVINGGFLRYEKVKNNPRVEPFRPKSRLQKFLLIDSGKPSENTAEMVAGVKERYKKEGRKYSQAFEKMGEISEEWLSMLKTKNGDLKTKIGELIAENEKELEKIGVVGKRAKEMIKEVNKIGGEVKICGAGGVKTGSGILLGYHQDLEKLKALVERKNWKYYEVELGSEGARYEKS